MHFVNIISLILVIVGGLNWLLVGLFNNDLVSQLLGYKSTPSRAVFILVGIAAIHQLVRLVLRKRLF